MEWARIMYGHDNNLFIDLASVLNQEKKICG